VLNELSSVKNALSVLVLALVVALYLFANSTFFETNQIEWTGLSHLSAEQLDAFLNMPVINVWRLDARSLAAQLTEHPWIESAKVTWRWPNRLIVRVQERFPIAQIPTDAGWVLLDKEGNILPLVQGATVYSLPVITNLDLEAKEQLIACARLITMIPQGLRESISEWNMQTRSFVTRAGVEILMGQPVELEEKFTLLGKIFEDLELRGQQPKRIDLRVPKSPVVSVL
jgi:cell division septal protein FtsQ